MRIGVLSDTHVSGSGRRVLPPRLWDDFTGVELILHAGDLISPRVISDLETIAPVLAIAGNNDSPALHLPLFRRLQLEGVIVGMAHGDRYALDAAASTSSTYGSAQPAGSAQPVGSAQPAARKRVPGSLPFPGNGQTSAFALSHVPDAAVMIFGHSHRPLIARATIAGEGLEPKRRVLLLNPGSPTDKRWSHNFGVALLQIKDGAAHAQALLW